jgi:hypothetical protein
MTNGQGGRSGRLRFPEEEENSEGVPRVRIPLFLSSFRKLVQRLANDLGDHLHAFSPFWYNI